MTADQPDVARFARLAERLNVAPMVDEKSAVMLVTTEDGVKYSVSAVLHAFLDRVGELDSIRS